MKITCILKTSCLTATLFSFSASLGMIMRQEDLQRELLLSLMDVGTKRAQFCLNAGAIVDDQSRDIYRNHTARELVLDRGQHGKEFRALIARERPDLVIDEPAGGYVEDSWNYAFRSLVASQIRAGGNLLRFGAGASRALLTHFLNSNNGTSDPDNGDNSPDQSLSNQQALAQGAPTDEVGQIAYFFLNDYERFKNKVRIFPSDIQKYIARRVLAQHPIMRMLYARSSQYAVTDTYESTITDKTRKHGPDKTLIRYFDIVVKDLPEKRTLWQINTDNEGYVGRITCADFNNACDKIISARRNGAITVHDANSGEILLELKGHTDKVNTIHFDPTDRFMVTASDDCTARVWDTVAGKCVSILYHDKAVNSAYFSNANPTLIVTASKDCTAKIWNYQKQLCLETLEGHTESVSTAGFNRSGDTVLTASKDKTVGLWKDGKNLLMIPCTSCVESAYFLPNESKILANLVTGQEDHRGELRANGWPSCIIDLNVMHAFIRWAESCSLEEALLLHAIFTLHTYDYVLAKKSQSHQPLLFDFNRCAHLVEVFQKMPNFVQEILKPYVQFSKIREPRVIEIREDRGS